MTTTPADVLRELLAQLPSPGSLSPEALVARAAMLGGLQAQLDAAKAAVAGEFEARSTLPREENPVTRAGHSSAAAFLAELWQVSRTAAGMFCRVGEATRPRTSLTGEVLPARFEQVGAGVAAGAVSVEKAAVIVRELGKAAVACPADALVTGERILVGFAPGYSVRELHGLAAQVRDRLDRDGVEPRELRQRRRREVTIRPAEDGMVRIHACLDPESAGYVVTGIDAIVTRGIRRVEFADRSDQPAPMDETRTLGQIRADALVEVFRHAAGCAQATGSGHSPVSVVVRIDLDTLRSGLGVGEIDGITAPISAGTVRRMAADAHLIPMVLGGKSQVLDLGRGKRLFTKAQRLALAERDGGCAWMGCPHPPSYTEAHHIRWWNAHTGPTDLDNGTSC